jgi:hypothetical protein
MPTNILRKEADARKPGGAGAARASPEQRIALLTAGRVKLRIELLDTPTAAVVWHALPLYSTVESWGATIHFQTPLETGRDRTARILANIGDIYFWLENDRILVPFGPSPISRPTECRLPAPCNVWARALDEVATLSKARPWEKVSLIAT